MKGALWCLAALLTACAAPASVARPPAAAPSPSASPSASPTAGASLIVDGKAPHALHWMRTAAEHRAIVLQAYSGAQARLREIATPLARGSWAVILDADETVLDNSAYFQRQALLGLSGFGFNSWIDFMKEGIAPALPGAVAFTHLVEELGGRVVIVTNRAENMCEATRINLQRADIPAAAVLCRPPGVQDKNPRFEAVAQGTVDGLPPLRVVMWLGDNIQDFPGRFQEEARTADESTFSEFGRSWWIFPNPMYGSWEGNPLPTTP